MAPEKLLRPPNTVHRVPRARTRRWGPGERETRPGERETRPEPMLLSQAQEKPGATSSHLNPVLAFILCKSQCPKEPGKDKELSVFLNTQLS